MVNQEEKEILEDKLEGLYQQYATERKNIEEGRATTGRIQQIAEEIVKYHEEYRTITGEYYTPKRAKRDYKDKEERYQW